MNTEEFRKHAHEVVEWMADYLEHIEKRPVRPNVLPRTIFEQLPPHPPVKSEPFDEVFRDFQNVILPGMTHWQHPSFFAYFPANSSPPSVLAEMLTATLGAQCMSWVTSPAATELEERVIGWLREMLGLPPAFTGVLQDTASTATLVALLTARETRSQYSVNESGFPVGVRFTVYSSTETHSSIEKGVKIAGIGKNGLRKIRVDDKYAMIPEELEKAVKRDLADGCTPLCTVATIGTTGSTAIDPVRAIGEICRQYRIWYHVDAAYGGTALLVPEMRWMGDGLDLADSFVVNPHKWMFTNFDCSAYFVRDPAALVKTFEILPEYLKTAEDSQVNNYRDWGIQLGRRFRALKLWFVIRTYGVDGLCEKIREHLALALSFVRTVESAADFEILAPVQLTTVCFRYHPAGEENLDTLNALNAALLDDLNKSGRLFLTHTKLDGRMALRLVVSQTNVGRKHVEAAWELISSTARALSPTTTS